MWNQNLSKEKLQELDKVGIEIGDDDYYIETTLKNSDKIQMRILESVESMQEKSVLENCFFS